jgi:hypothetical protein
VLHHDPDRPSAAITSYTCTTLGWFRPRRGAGLPQRAALHRVAFVVGAIRRQDDLLDRHIALEHVVVGEPDPAHAARAQRGAQPVATGEAIRSGGHAP